MLVIFVSLCCAEAPTPRLCAKRKLAVLMRMALTYANAAGAEPDAQKRTDLTWPTVQFSIVPVCPPPGQLARLVCERLCDRVKLRRDVRLARPRCQSKAPRGLLSEKSWLALHGTLAFLGQHHARL